MEKMMESGVQRHAQSGSVAAHLDYREVERVFELDTSFNSGRAEIWQLVRNDLGEMNRFMRDGVLALREVKEVSEEQAHPSPGEGEMAQSVRNWLGADGSQRDRKSVVAGKSVSGRVDLGGRSNSKKKKNKTNNE